MITSNPNPSASAGLGANRNGAQTQFRGNCHEWARKRTATFWQPFQVRETCASTTGQSFPSRQLERDSGPRSDYAAAGVRLTSAAFSSRPSVVFSSRPASMSSCTTASRSIASVTGSLSTWHGGRLPNTAGGASPSTARFTADTHGTFASTCARTALKRARPGGTSPSSCVQRRGRGRCQSHANDFTEPQAFW
eukprot:1724728-Pleurochrysis_carterae.AAC.4